MTGLLSKSLELATDPMVLGKAIDYLRGFVKQFPLLAVEQSNPTQIPVHGPRITIRSARAELKPDVIKKSDRIITSTNPIVIRSSVLRELATQGAFELRRKELEKATADRTVLASPKFTLERWPFDPLMRHLRQAITPYVQAYLAETQALCDPQG